MKGTIKYIQRNVFTSAKRLLFDTMPQA